MTNTQALGALLARVLISAIFIVSGLTKIATFDATQAYMAANGMPATGFFLIASIVVELAGGFSILFGVLTRAGASMLFLYLIPVTLVFHAFWAYAGAEQQMQAVSFLKNLAVMGGLLYVALRPVDRYSVDDRLHTMNRLRIGRWQPTRR